MTLSPGGHPSAPSGGCGDGGSAIPRSIGPIDAEPAHCRRPSGHEAYELCPDTHRITAPRRKLPAGLFRARVGRDKVAAPPGRGKSRPCEQEIVGSGHRLGVDTQFVAKGPDCQLTISGRSAARQAQYAATLQVLDAGCCLAVSTRNAPWFGHGFNTAGPRPRRRCRTPHRECVAAHVFTLNARSEAQERTQIASRPAHAGHRVGRGRCDGAVRGG